jgi:drug/metabolite transporter (DMT)-like permease
VLGYVLFDERLSLWVWAAIALMAIGVMLVQPRAKAAGVQAAAEKRL